MDGGTISTLLGYSSVDVENETLLLGKICVSVGETEGAATGTLATQHEVDALVEYLFERRFGWSERGVAGIVSDGPTNDDEQRAELQVLAEGPSGEKRRINVAIDDLLQRMRSELDVSSGMVVVRALSLCVTTTNKPVVRQQAFQYFFDLLKAVLTRTQVDLADEDFERARLLMVAGLTDVWSAIRRTSANRFYSVIHLFPMPRVESLFGDLVLILSGGEDPLLQQGPSPVWQAKEGALLALASLIKRFRRSTGQVQPGIESESGDADATAETKDAPTAVAIPTPLRAIPTAEHTTLVVDSLVHSQTLHESPSSLPASPSGSKQVFFTDTANAASTVCDSGPLGQRRLPARPRPGDTNPAPASASSGAATPVVDNHGCATVATTGMCLYFGPASETPMAGLPSFMSEVLQPLLFTMLGHMQLSVRENAIKAFAAFLSRSVAARSTQTLVETIRRLDNTPASVMGPDDMVADAFLAEGLLGLSLTLVRIRGLIPAAAIHTHRHQILGTLERYLAHDASTVRQATSAVYRHLATKECTLPGGKACTVPASAAGQADDVLLVLVLQHLVDGWPRAKEGVDAGTRGAPTHGVDGDAARQVGQSEWQGMEGRLLAYELLVQFLLKDHELVVGRQQKATTHHHAGRAKCEESSVAAPSPAFELCSCGGPDDSGAMLPGSSSFRTPLKATVGDIPWSPGPSPSPIVTLTATTPGTPHHSLPGATHDGGGASRAGSVTLCSVCGGAASSNSNLRVGACGGSAPTNVSPLPSSVVDELRSIRRPASAARTVAQEEACVRGGRGHKQLDDLMYQMLMQTRECLPDNGRFELRRMAGQVLAPLARLVAWYDLSILDRLWLAIPAFLETRDTLSCRLAVETLRAVLQLCATEMQRLQTCAAAFGDGGNGSQGPSDNASMAGHDTLQSEMPSAKLLHRMADSLHSLLPGLHALARLAVTERLFVTTMDVMFRIYSWFGTATDGTAVRPWGAHLAEAHSSVLLERLVWLETHLGEGGGAGAVARDRTAGDGRREETQELRKRQLYRRAQMIDASLREAVAPALFVAVTNMESGGLARLLPTLIRWVTTEPQLAPARRSMLLASTICAAQRIATCLAFEGSTYTANPEHIGQCLRVLQSALSNLCPLLEAPNNPDQVGGGGGGTGASASALAAQELDALVACCKAYQVATAVGPPTVSTSASPPHQESAGHGFVVTRVLLALGQRLRGPFEETVVTCAEGPPRQGSQWGMGGAPSYGPSHAAVTHMAHALKWRSNDIDCTEVLSPRNSFTPYCSDDEEGTPRSLDGILHLPKHLLRQSSGLVPLGSKNAGHAESTKDRHGGALPGPMPTPQTSTTAGGTVRSEDHLGGGQRRIQQEVTNVTGEHDEESAAAPLASNDSGEWSDWDEDEEDAMAPDTHRTSKDSVADLLVQAQDVLDALGISVLGVGKLSDVPPDTCRILRWALDSR